MLAITLVMATVAAAARDAVVVVFTEDEDVRQSMAQLLPLVAIGIVGVYVCVPPGQPVSCRVRLQPVYRMTGVGVGAATHTCALDGRVVRDWSL